METISRRNFWLDILANVEEEGLPCLPPKKKFTPKYNLPILEDYSVPAPESFWEKFPCNYVMPKPSLIDWKELECLAIKVNYPDKKLLSKVVSWLKEGAKIGCSQKFRKPSVAKNSKSAIINGYRVTDTICDWVNKGFVMGPVDLKDIPVNAKVSGMMTRDKPNGAVRCILNLSSPKGLAVNEGISSEDFPTKMSSTTEWLRVLNRAGRDCFINKQDWSDAYKHIGVHPDDLNLQWFKWLGRGFVELCLIFGAVSSAGIFDAVAKIVIFIVIKLSGMDPTMVCQHLDDCVAAAPKNSDALHRFDQQFQDVAKRLGIRLAPRSDPEKSFAPCKSGVVLGVWYCTEKWMWGIPSEKLTRLLNTISEVINTDMVSQREIWSLVGKLIHIRPLIPGGQYHMNYLMEANSKSTDGEHKILITSEMRSQLHFWLKILPMCSGRIPIPDPDKHLPPWAIEVFTDAAGGSWGNKNWHGAGAVTYGWWAFVPWSNKINAGADNGFGKRLDRCMSALELVGPLLTVSSGHMWCRNNVIKIFVDNSGSVAIFKKGYSASCKLSTTLVKAITTVSAGIQCQVEILKITRCSTPMATLSDLLSKGAFQKFWSHAKSIPSLNLPLDMGIVPKSLLKWLKDPKPDDMLGHKILQEIGETSAVLSYNC